MVMKVLRHGIHGLEVKYVENLMIPNILWNSPKNWLKTRKWKWNSENENEI